jgi:hypothetical protein
VAAPLVGQIIDTYMKKKASRLEIAEVGASTELETDAGL